MRTELLCILFALLLPLQPVLAGAAPHRLGKRHDVRARPVPLPLQRVAYCESRNRHYDHHGKVLQGKKNCNDMGTYQINCVWHERRAKQLEYNIWSPHGNAGYALWLYREHGLAPWAATARCQRHLARRGVMPPR
jgi:hypothetical protein